MAWDRNNLSWSLFDCESEYKRFCHNAYFDRTLYAWWNKDLLLCMVEDVYCIRPLVCAPPEALPGSCYTFCTQPYSLCVMRAPKHVGSSSWSEKECCKFCTALCSYIRGSRKLPQIPTNLHQFAFNLPPFLADITIWKTGVSLKVDPEEDPGTNYAESGPIRLTGALTGSQSLPINLTNHSPLF